MISIKLTLLSTFILITSATNPDADSTLISTPFTPGNAHLIEGSTLLSSPSPNLDCRDIAGTYNVANLNGSLTGESVLLSQNGCDVSSNVWQGFIQDDFLTYELDSINFNGEVMWAGYIYFENEFYLAPADKTPRADIDFMLFKALKAVEGVIQDGHVSQWEVTNLLRVQNEEFDLGFDNAFIESKVAAVFHVLEADSDSDFTISEHDINELIHHFYEHITPRSYELLDEIWDAVQLTDAEIEHVYDVLDRNGNGALNVADLTHYAEKRFGVEFGTSFETDVNDILEQFIGHTSFSQQEFKILVNALFDCGHETLQELLTAISEDNLDESILLEFMVCVGMTTGFRHDELNFMLWQAFVAVENIMEDEQLTRTELTTFLIEQNVHFELGFDETFILRKANQIFDVLEAETDSDDIISLHDFNELKHHLFDHITNASYALLDELFSAVRLSEDEISHVYDVLDRNGNDLLNVADLTHYVNSRFNILFDESFEDTVNEVIEDILGQSSFTREEFSTLVNAGFDCGHTALYSAMQMISEDSVDEESLLGEFLECISDAGFTTKPTVLPTYIPSLFPTISLPSLLPTWAPTFTFPSEIPSKAPTFTSPSFSPSLRPTGSPSSSMPTKAPTELPSSIPSRIPTMSSPTKSPSDFPTSNPSLMPTTEEPTLNPSLMPTTEEPTFAPSSSNPSQVPSNSPSSSDPTCVPTTTSPSTLPTAVPTTSSPTFVPSVLPTTNEPTSLPTRLPTTDKPTSLPTRCPTTDQPTSLPTRLPTTAKPTFLPSPFPTTDEPTPLPSLLPTTESPTNWPTTSPETSIPTFAPTASGPTISPTSSNPSFIPSQSPVSSIPTASPETNEPSLHPSSTQPSASPTELPTTSMPSHAPTSAPSTDIPSNLPTSSPVTSIPTELPTSSMPTMKPSFNPMTSEPTFHPATSIPTFSPTTSIPTADPITTQPTLNPTEGGEFVSFDLRGRSGMERVMIEVGGVQSDDVVLSTQWRTFSYPMPANKQWSVDFKNDAGGRDVYFQSDLLYTVTHDHFDGWRCNQRGENGRCRRVRDEGFLAWSGKYTYTLDELESCSGTTVMASRCGSLTAPAEVTADGNAVIIPNGNGNNGQGKIEFEIQCEANPPALNLKVEVLSPTGRDDSYWVRIDNENRHLFSAGARSYWWFRDPPQMSITQGRHTLKFEHREDGISMRRVKIVSSGCQFVDSSEPAPCVESQMCGCPSKLLPNPAAGYYCTAGNGLDSNHGHTKANCDGAGGQWLRYTCQEAEDYLASLTDEAVKDWLRQNWWQDICCSSRNPSGFGVREAGFCVQSNGSDQNSHVTRAPGSFSNPESCLDWCDTQSGLTGCEYIWGQGNHGCYAHRGAVSHGNGRDRHYCWIKGTSRRNLASSDRELKNRLLQSHLPEVDYIYTPSFLTQYMHTPVKDDKE